MLRYVRRALSALELVDSPLSVLNDTTALARGASILPAAQLKCRQRGAQVRTRRPRKSGHCRQDSWVVARHLSLRYGVDVVPLQAARTHSALHVAEGQNRELAVLTVVCSVS